MYTRPFHDQVDFDWQGEPTYIRPAANQVNFDFDVVANVPTNLRASAITATSARLEWDAVT
jgi:hypothetical protein